jgi:hypothetical protein
MTDWEPVWLGLLDSTRRSLVGDGDEHLDDELAAVLEFPAPVESEDEPEVES